VIGVDPLAGSAWSAPGTVAGFSTSAPNPVLMTYASRQRRRSTMRVLDIGCGAGRNAVPLAASGLLVIGTDLSWPMLCAAADRGAGTNLRLVLAPMDVLPVGTGTVDLVIAHGIWNLARSGLEFRRAVAEAARVASPGASLFVFTFSRRTLPPSVAPVAGESFIFTEFSGSPQVFLTEYQLVEQLGAAGFVPDPALPLRELNVPAPGEIRSAGTPVIYEAGFRMS
jgi:SAM-dependent methyltransferase